MSLKLMVCVERMGRCEQQHQLEGTYVVSIGGELFPEESISY